jgi:hypothetical protein
MPYTESWGMVKPFTISSSWKKIIPGNEEDKCLDFDEAINLIFVLAFILVYTDSCENANTENNEF